MRLRMAPFVRRALVQDGRALRTYAFRLVLLAIVFVTTAFAQAFAAYFGAPGLRMLSGIAGLDAFFICLTAPMLFASVVTREREDMTLELLMATGLGRLSLLLGLAAGGVVTALMLLVAQVPFVVLAVTLGGVTLMQVGAVFVALGAHLVFMAGLGTLCSTVCVRGSRATTLCVLLLLGFFIAPGAAMAISMSLSGWGASGGMAQSLLGPVAGASVFTRLEEIMTTGFAGPLVSWQAVANVALAVLLFLAAWRMFARTTERAASAAPDGTPLLASVKGRRRRRVGRAWDNAPAWLGFNFAAGGRGAVLVKFAVYGLIIAVILFLVMLGGEAPDSEAIGGVMVTVTLVALVVEVTAYHSRVASMEWRGRTLSALAVLPMPLTRTLRRKMLGCLLSLGPALAWFSLGAALCAGEFFSGLDDGYAPFLGFLVYSAVVLALFWEMTALFSVLVRRGAVLLAVGTCMVLFWLSWIPARMLMVVGPEWLVIILIPCGLAALWFVARRLTQARLRRLVGEA